MANRFTLLLLAFLVPDEVHSVTGPLNRFVRHYERLDYDRHDIAAQHQRARRSASHPVVLDFHAHGKYFNFHMRPDTSVFTKDVEFVTQKGEPIPYDPQQVYRGTHQGDPTTIIYGIMSEDGIFDGAIHSSNEKYYIEPASHHNLLPHGGHSVIYKGSDVVYDLANQTSCGAKAEMMKELNEMNKLPEEEIRRRESQLRRSYRYKRAASNLDDTKTECQILITADQKLFKYLGNSASKALNLLVNHVLEANTIFPKTDFDAQEGADLISIAIRRAVVWNDAPSNSEFGEEFLGVNKFLDIWSLDDHDEFCLAYLFTYRDFDDGVLGLAYVGSTSTSTAGGICEKHAVFSGGVSKSLNTGVVSLLNYGQSVPTTVSRITFAHEIGHNFGSPHDMSAACTPGGSQGNFIMYFRATTGNDPNNDQFSPCSRDLMGSVIFVKGQGEDGCFQASTGSICGNSALEPGEECDCGFEEECQDDCCFPGDHSDNSLQCKLKRSDGAVCSPQQGLCCNKTCQFYSVADSHVCQTSVDCLAQSKCDGTSSVCPLSPDTAAKNGDLCNNGANVCSGGECNDTICTIIGRTQCECTASSHLCDVCCMVPNDNGDMVCTSSYEITGLTGVRAPSGTACNNNQGYCDYFDTCRLVDLDGPLARLKNLLFSSDSIETAKEWLAEYWYAAVLGGIGLIILMALFIWLCSKKTPRSYPKRPGQGKRGMEMKPR